MDPFLYRLLKVFRCGSYQRALPVDGQEVLDARRMIELVQQVVGEAAATGNCVIVGRGSAYFLRERTDTLRVFLFASREFKIRSLQTQTKKRSQSRGTGRYSRPQPPGVRETLLSCGTGRTARHITPCSTVSWATTSSSPQSRTCWTQLNKGETSA